MTVTVDIGTGIVVCMAEVAGTFGLQVRKMWLILIKTVMCKFNSQGCPGLRRIVSVLSHTEELSRSFYSKTAFICLTQLKRLG